MFPIEQATDEIILTLYTSICGAIISLTTACLLIIDVAMRYRKTKSKTAYLMVLIYLILISLASFSYTFIRTNAVTRIENNQFTEYQCAIGFVMQYCSYYVSM